MGVSEYKNGANLVASLIHHDLENYGISIVPAPLSIPLLDIQWYITPDMELSTADFYCGDKHFCDKVREYAHSLSVLIATGRSSISFLALDQPKEFECSEIGESGGVTIRMLRAYDIRVDRMLTRIDVLIVGL